ncbi:hypothetical protein AB0D94_02700 [Streptomyces sp. NPDC048255]|uniref:hypothetical protein n=1 Tax=Streptomyces sp. NPDC048255 TaxID=3154713 RepID=UPI0033EFFB1E
MSTAPGPSPSTSPAQAVGGRPSAGGGFVDHDAAETALDQFLEGEAGGFDADPNQTVAAYLNAWLTAKALVLKPTTIARYRDYVHNDLVPEFGTLRLDQLAHRHVSAFVTSQLAAGRGETTLYRCPPGHHHAEDPLEPRLSGHLAPRRHRPPALCTNNAPNARRS